MQGGTDNVWPAVNCTGVSYVLSVIQARIISGFLPACPLPRRNGDGDVMRSAHASAPVHPRRLWYWVAGCLLAAAAAWIKVRIVGVFRLDRHIPDFRRAPVPGHATVPITRPAGYVLHSEGPGSCCSCNNGGGTAGESGAGPPFPSWSI